MSLGEPLAAELHKLANPIGVLSGSPGLALKMKCFFYFELTIFFYLSFVRLVVRRLVKLLQLTK